MISLAPENTLVLPNPKEGSFNLENSKQEYLQT